jgi:hypothetical protein
MRLVQLDIEPAMRRIVSAQTCTNCRPSSASFRHASHRPQRSHRRALARSALRAQPTHRAPTRAQCRALKTYDFSCSLPNPTSRFLEPNPRMHRGISVKPRIRGTSRRIWESSDNRRNHPRAGTTFSATTLLADARRTYGLPATHRASESLGHPSDIAVVATGHKDYWHIDQASSVAAILTRPCSEGAM